MDRDSSRAGGNNHGLGLIEDFEAVIGGVFIGLASFLIKIVMESFSLDFSFIVSLILNPVTWIAVICGGIGFLLFQKALHGGKVSVVTPVMAGFGIIVPIILAIAFLGEAITSMHSLGLVLILIGVFLLAKE